MAGIYGLKIRDSSGNIIHVTPEVSTLVSAGSPYVPTTLRPDNTFGINVKLPGLSNFDETDIGIVANIRKWSPTLSLVEVADVDPNPQQWFYMKMINVSRTYYEYNPIDGTMSVFTPEVNKDTIFNQHGIVFWDKPSTADSANTFDTVRLFSAIILYIYDHSTTTYKKIYTLGLLNKIDYAVFLKNLSG